MRSRIALRTATAVDSRPGAPRAWLAAATLAVAVAWAPAVATGPPGAPEAFDVEAPDNGTLECPPRSRFEIWRDDGAGRGGLVDAAGSAFDLVADQASGPWALVAHEGSTVGRMELAADGHAVTLVPWRSGAFACLDAQARLALFAPGGDSWAVRAGRHGDLVAATRAEAQARTAAEEGRHAAAAALVEHALSLRARWLGDRAPASLALRRLLVELLTRLRVISAMRREAGPLLDAHRAVFAPGDRRLLDALNVAANAWKFAGEPARALALYDEAVASAVAFLGERDSQTLVLLSGLAGIYWDLDRKADAEALYVRVYAAQVRELGEDATTTVRTLERLAGVRVEQRRAAANIDVQRSVLAHYRGVYGPQHPETLRALNNVGAAYARADRDGEALAWYREAYETRRTVLGPGHASTLWSMANVAGTLWELGRTAEAEAMQLELADLARRHLGETHPDTVLAVEQVARDHEARGRTDAAIDELARVVDAIEAHRARGDLAPENRRALFASWVPTYELLAHLLAAQGRVDEAFRIAELTKARTLLESLQSRIADRHPDLPASARERLEASAQRVAQLDESVLRAPDELARAGLESERNALLRATADYRRELAAAHPRYARATEVAIVGARDAMRGLAGDEAFIGFVGNSRRRGILAIVLRRDRPFAAFVSAAAIAQAVPAWRALLDPARPRALRAWRLADGSFVAALAAPAPDAIAVGEDALAAHVGNLVLAPLAAALTGTKRWIVAPGGPLSAIPFQALRKSGAGRVGERVTIRYTPSFSVYEATRTLRRTPSVQASALLGIGAPRYAVTASADAANRGLRLAPLPGARRELERVAALFPGRVRLLVGAAANESTLAAMNERGELARFRYVHVAAHAYLSTAHPGLSAFVLSQPDGGAADGYLTAAELVAYTFDAAAFVASACETAAGTYAEGEGLLGLSFALSVAGARASVLSLWRIDDAFAERFVGRLFARLRAGVAPADALAATQREFRGNARWSDPAHWSAFVVYGG